MAGEWVFERISDIADVIDYVANGSFESLRNNVKYRNAPDYAVLVRLVDHNAGWNGGFVYVDRASYDFLRKSALVPGDIVIANVGANAGTVFRVPDLGTPMTLGPNAVLCRPKQKDTLRKDFLYYYLISGTGQESLCSILSGSAQPKFNKTDLRTLSVPIPPLPEQRAIAHVLGALDDKIELNRRMSETLEAMARTLFKSWFVDFDPVRAKISGRDPGLPQALADLFPARLVDSELGEIPEGWKVGCVDDEFDLTMGQSPPGETYNEAGEGLPFYQGRADFGSRFPTRRVYCTAPTRLARTGDTLISVRAPVGDINMATEDCAIGRGVAAARHKSGSRSYTYQFMRSLDEVFGRFEAEGTVFGSIGKKDFHAISCARAPRAVIREFEAMLAPIDNRIDVIERESRTLATLRDTLLPKLISGELRVSDAENFIQKVS